MCWSMGNWVCFFLNILLYLHLIWLKFISIRTDTENIINMCTVERLEQLFCIAT